MMKVIICGSVASQNNLGMSHDSFWFTNMICSNELFVRESEFAMWFGITNGLVRSGIGLIPRLGSDVTVYSIYQKTVRVFRYVI